MYDQETAALIRVTPFLEGLDRESLPDLLSKTFTQIAAARVRLRNTEGESPEELTPLVKTIRSLAYTNEALVSVSPNREDRRAAAFVAATAHQLCFNADKLIQGQPPSTFVNGYTISSNIAAMLLFMVAEATADAAEVSKSVKGNSNDSIEQELILSLKDLANGRLQSLTSRTAPKREAVISDDPARMAERALWLTIHEGIKVFAKQMLLGKTRREPRDPAAIFERVCELCIGPVQNISSDWVESSSSFFSGPHHLASLLIAVVKDLSHCAVTQIPPPPGLDLEKWHGSVLRIAKSRPYLWRNHRNAIDQGFLRVGTSSAVGFPTGAGKSTLADLKIITALLSGKNVIFLAPTHALVDQTSQSLARSFPTAAVQRERQDEFGFATGDDELPDIFVMTPEACLTQMSIAADVFKDVGLLVFDECHLLHPNDNSNNRRAIDAMLCLLNLSHIALDADFLLLSAMMKNSDAIAGWITELTGRPCLSLALPWKPTRQLRGSVVYDQQTVTNLGMKLKHAKLTAPSKNPPVAIKRELNAIPLALFSLKQTWATTNSEDYVLVGLLKEPVRLAASKYWRLTPNAVAVSSSISAASAETGLKTLVFFQTIKNAVSAAQKISGIFESLPIKLIDKEVDWLNIAITELGDPSHLFIQVENNKVVQSATVHHGLLMPEERYLCESLYKRPDGIKVMTATSTLAQGMNLPSELVIIGEDSRFDQVKEKREILKAQELLNAAGRAGRAGENSTGIVLVVPGNVVGIDLDASTIGSHWGNLREIFGQSDQCLEIDDPLTAVLDRVHTATGKIGDQERYTLVRLASGGRGDTDTESLSNAIKSTFGAYLSRKKQDESWVQERIVSATKFFEDLSPETEKELVENQVAATLGLSVNLVSRLSVDLEIDKPQQDAKVPEWRRWFFHWLSENPDLLEQICRRQSLAELFGEKFYNAFANDEDRSKHVLPILNKLIWLWMKGECLSELEKALGTSPKKLNKCMGARRFVLRIVPDFSYLFGLPALLHDRAQLNKKKPALLQSVPRQLGRCVRLGFNSHEKSALYQILIKSRISRRQLHQKFESLKSYIPTTKPNETWDQTLERVRDGLKKERNAK